MSAVEEAPVEQLGSIFVDPVAYAEPVRWHAAARIRAERPILPVEVPGYPRFWAITKHADVIRDVTFEPGDLLLLSYASANRDDEVFEDPFRLDVTRPNAASHLAFGFGRHFCLGSHLARMEVRALFKELLGRLEHIEPDGGATWVQSHFVQGPKRVPVRYRLRPSPAKEVV
jgi:hypothetical protein